jgi:hypothetical protein
MKTLKCKQAAGLISLYVAGDLESAAERGLAAHLGTCKNCREIAEEFSVSGSLLTQACAPPEFDAEFYAGIRQSVLGEIARDRRHAKSPFVRRRWLYATSFAAVALVGMVMLLHFVSTRDEQPAGLAVAAADQTGHSTAGQAREGDSSSSHLAAGQSPRHVHNKGIHGVPEDKLLAVATTHRRTRHFNVVAGEGTRDTATVQQRTRVAPTISESNATSGIASVSATRTFSSQLTQIEIQTANPNIRIIWLVPRESEQPTKRNTEPDQNENGDRN